MAVESRRGCGYRKIGGLYLVGGGAGIACDRLPFELCVCPTCNQGIKPARGWTWCNVAALFQGAHTCWSGYPADQYSLCACASTNFCPLCVKPEVMGRAGLVWIGEKFYRSPDAFIAEGRELGLSRRIKAVPQGFKIGETWVLLAHAKALGSNIDGDDLPGIFCVWRPSRLEKIMPESSRGSEEVAALEKRGISPVFVPDNDPDHQGTVYDKEGEAL